MDKMVSCSSLSVPYQYRKGHPLWPGRGVSLTWCPSRMKLSRSSRGARARTQGREAWCMPEYHSHIHCRQKGNFMKAPKILLKLNQIVLTFEDIHKYKIIERCSHQVLQSMKTSSLGRNSSVPFPDGIPQWQSFIGTQCPSCSSCPSGHRQPESVKNIKYWHFSYTAFLGLSLNWKPNCTSMTGFLQTLHVFP